MNEYIDKNKLLEALKKLKPDAAQYGSSDTQDHIATVEDAAYWTAKDIYSDFIEQIEKAALADVVHVVHGHWKWSPKHEEYECSNCGESAPCDGWHDELLSDYCPYCGAKMDEED